QQQPTVGENKPDSSGGRNQEKALEVVGTLIEANTLLRYKASPYLKSSMLKEKRKIKEHIPPGNGNSHEKNEQELDGTRKEGPGQSGLENVGRRSMLHWEYQANVGDSCSGNAIPGVLKLFFNLLQDDYGLALFASFIVMCS
ncbi:unnamed protein product, partial [Schistosoma mattheei]